MRQLINNRNGGGTLLGNGLAAEVPDGNGHFFKVCKPTIASVSIGLALILALSGCEADELNEKEQADRASWFTELFTSEPDPVTDCAALREWLAGHGDVLVSRIERTGLLAELHYRPALLQACADHGDASYMDPEFQAHTGRLAHSEAYVLRLQMPGANFDELELGEQWRKDIVEVIGQDTIPCAFIHAETVPHFAPYRTLLIGFDRSQDNVDRKVVLRDRENVLGGDLILKFTTGFLKDPLVGALNAAKTNG
jgi:hypothetical protein